MRFRREVGGVTCVIVRDREVSTIDKLGRRPQFHLNIKILTKKYVQYSYYSRFMLIIHSIREKLAVEYQ